MRRPRAKTAPLAAAALVAALVPALYGRVLRLWWTFDDFFCLHFLRDHTAAACLFSPAAWAPSRMFTPLLFLSMESDLRAFGLRPVFFYGHQLVALAATAVALFALLRLWLEAGVSCLTSALFVLGAPMGSWVQELLVRHYIEGLLGAVLATWCFVRSSREARPALGGISALLYLLAMLAKEVYVPLLVLLLILPEGSFRSRVRRAWPQGLALVVYLAWRYAILGTVMGGYGWTIRAEELPRLIVELPGKFGASLFGASAPGNVLLALLLALGAAGALVHRSRAVGLLLASLVLVASPVLTVSKAFRPHYAGLAWLTLAIAFGFGCQALLDAGRVPRAAVGLLAAATLGAAFAANRHAWHAGYDRAERGSVEGRAFLAMKDGELLRHPSIPPAAMMELRWFKEVGLALPKGAGWFDDDLYVCAADRNIRGIREYDPRTRSLVDATERLPGIRSNYCAALRDAPLEAAFWRSADGLFWELGPYPSGRYALVFFDGVERVDVARRDGYRNDATVLTLRVRYEAPEGWVTFSPELSADLRAGRPFRWERAAAGR